MKITRLIKAAALALVGLAFAFGSITRTEAQTIITSWTNTFPNNGNTGMYPQNSWTYWYSLYQDTSAAPGDYNLAGTNDANMDYTGDTNDSGSMYVYAPWDLITNGSSDQNVFNISFGNSQQMLIINVTNISWYIHVAPNSVTNADGNFGTLSAGFFDTAYGREDTVYLTIPGSATNGWVLMSETNIAAFSSAASAAASSEKITNPDVATAIGLAFDQNSYGSSPQYPTNALVYWIDNITVQTSAAPPPPPPPPSVTIAPAVQGLNLFTGSGTALYNRENIQASQGEYTWVGASGPVTYSFTITNYPVATNDAVQTQIFLAPTPGTENDPDWNEANVVFIDMESSITYGGGANMYFRYKTNEPNGNTMIYGPGTLAGIGTNTAIGTWSVTFVNNTNVTMTAPGGASTNFSIPDSTGATAALFASGVNIYFGDQAGNAGGANDHIVVSDFKVTGTANDFDDNFVADDGVLNQGIWKTNAAFPNCIQLVGPGVPYWVDWTTPAPNYVLDTTDDLVSGTWTAVTNYAAFTVGTNIAQLVSTNDLQSTSNAFFAVIQHNYSLQILWPGETAAPGTPTGKTGTPTPVSIASGGVTFTVNAVDSKFNVVSSINDNISFSSSDSAATLPSNGPLSGGTGQFTITFATAGSQTVTATDAQNAGIAAGNSSPVTVTP
ncbi:MAG TPA: hypothetical protein VGO67_12980 [Verrucomicrobiae bacterium]|jgi:hypothetical protein